MKPVPWYLKWLGDPRTWPTFWHTATQWQHFSMPDCEQVDVPKGRRLVGDTRTVRWPSFMAGQSTNLTDPGTVPKSGSPVGTPMQHGTADWRPLRWGRAEHGEQFANAFVNRIPKPRSGTYWTRGWPVPAWDRHCCVVAPGGWVFELIQFDPAIAEGAQVNHARGWGEWFAGELISGRATTATGIPHHRHVWTPWSRENPHELSIVLCDYVGADGLLTQGPRAGSRLALSPSSLSYSRMVALGGECAVIAQACVDHGLDIIDRSGYADVAGTKPYAPSIQFQPGGQWAGRNIGRFTVALADLREVIE